MSLERFKTQILLLHGEQSALDRLSSGFSDRYTVHCATSGSEALTTLGEIPIDVIVSAQQLPGMSGLEALREARKRSPDTIGILLAGNDDAGLEALVGDKELFQVVRGAVTPDSLKSLIDGATQQARLMALAESANDIAANPDEPSGEHIVMETSENGSTIISDGTGRLPALDPQKIPAAADVGARSVDVLVLTQDEEFLNTIRESARGLHNVIAANTPQQADEAVGKHRIGVAVVDAAIVGANVEKLTLHLRNNVPRLVAIVAGRRDDGEMLMDLINRGKVYRFLLKPVSPGRARLAVEASVKHHLEAPDSAFLKAGAAASAKAAFKSGSAAKPQPAPQPKTTPDPKAAARPQPTPQPKTTPDPKPAARTQPTPQPKTTPNPKPAARTQPVPQAGPRPAPRPEPKPRPQAKTTTPEAHTADAAPKPEPKAGMTARRDDALSPNDAGLSDAFGADDKSLSDTMTGIANAVRKPFSRNRDTQPSGDGPVTASASGGSLVRSPKVLALAAIAVIASAGAAFWVFGGPDTPIPDAQPFSSTPSVTEADLPPDPQTAVDAASEIDDLLQEARLAADAGQVYDPPGGNAIELYLAATEVAPGNETVQAEFAAIIEQALTLAESALLERRLADAGAALERVELAQPGNSRLPFLTAQLSQLQVREYLDSARTAIREGRYEDARASIDNARAVPVDDTSEIDLTAEELSAALSEQQVDEVLTRASARLEEGKLISPSNDNARYFYELALTNDPDNSAARQGLITVADKLVLRARAEIDVGNLNLGEDLIAEARRLDPTSSELAAAANALQAARDSQEQERIAAEQRAAEQRAAAERAAAERAAADREAAERAAAEKAAAERAVADAAAAERQAAEKAAAAQAADQEQPPVAMAAQADTNTVADAVEQEQPSADSTQAEVTDTASAAETSAAESVRPVPVSSLNRTKYVAPRYPRSAQRRGVSGWVDVVFTVDIDGSVAEIDVINSDPGTTFVDAATNAVENWEFEPVIENGVAIRQRAAVRMMFAME